MRKIILDLANKTEKRKFKLHWKDGIEEIFEGTDIADAFNHAGYGAGALSALDYYEEIK